MVMQLTTSHFLILFITFIMRGSYLYGPKNLKRLIWLQTFFECFSKFSAEFMQAVDLLARKALCQAQFIVFFLFSCFIPFFFAQPFDPMSADASVTILGLLFPIISSFKLHPIALLKYF